MTRRVTISSLLAILSVASMPSFSQGHGHTHLHGIASLQIAVDGSTLTLRLRTPLENLVGFEHAPRTEQQKKAIADMEQSLHMPPSHFAPTAAAGCTPVATKLDSPFPAAAKTDVRRSDDQAQAAARKESKERDVHAELSAEFVFRCQNPDRLQGIEVKLFDSFRKLRRVDVELAGPRGQKSYRLTATSRVARW
jgi:hypothetical protein